jgi:hypothetical protein
MYEDVDGRRAGIFIVSIPQDSVRSDVILVSGFFFPRPRRSSSFRKAHALTRGPAVQSFFPNRLTAPKWTMTRRRNLLRFNGFSCHCPLPPQEEQRWNRSKPSSRVTLKCTRKMRTKKKVQHKMEKQRKSRVTSAGFYGFQSCAGNQTKSRRKTSRDCQLKHLTSNQQMTKGRKEDQGTLVAEKMFRFSRTDFFDDSQLFPPSLFLLQFLYGLAVE